jgi:putative nucleotidyltransferase with HDIG domain
MLFSVGARPSSAADTQGASQNAWPLQSKSLLAFWRERIPLVVFGLGLALSLGFILASQFLPNPLQPAPAVLKIGDVARQTIRSPQRLTYTSQIRTLEAQKQAMEAVADVYDYNPGLAFQQKTRATYVGNYITFVRDDSNVTLERKIDDIQRIPELTTSPVITAAFQLDSRAWQEVVTETVRVVDEVMRERIRKTNLADVKAEVPKRLSQSLSKEQATVAAGLVRSFLKENDILDPLETSRRKREAASLVDPVRFTVEKDEVVIREGNVLTAPDLERLQALGLLRRTVVWPDLVGLALFVLAVVVPLVIYLYAFQPTLWPSARRLLLVGVVIVGTAALASLLVPGHSTLPYLFPVAAATMLLTALLGGELALVVAVTLSLIIGYLGGDSLELTVMTLVAGAMGALSLRRLERLSNFFQVGFLVALANMAVAMAFRLPDRNLDPLGVAQIGGLSLGNGLLSAALAIAGLFVLGNVFGLTTTLQLLELAHPAQPLFRRLLLGAPGTYHHSVLVSNLAERAAEAIGADSLLVRVAAYYHDIGKVLRPYFFIENQLNGNNVHDQLDCQASAQAIIAHVPDGIALARKYGLPQKIVDLIAQHHGTQVTGYFYAKACQAQNGNSIDPAAFRYPGPRPQSKEAGILMLADSLEATVRANKDHSPEAIERLIRETMQAKLSSGQLDECDLTLRDLERIRQAFGDVLQGVYHPRIAYPAAAQAVLATPPSALLEQPTPPAANPPGTHDADR